MSCCLGSVSMHNLQSVCVCMCVVVGPAAGTSQEIKKFSEQVNACVGVCCSVHGSCFRYLIVLAVCLSPHVEKVAVEASVCVCVTDGEESATWK